MKSLLFLCSPESEYNSWRCERASMHATLYSNHKMIEWSFTQSPLTVSPSPLSHVNGWITNIC
jgi:hypothetical protein